MSIQNFNIIKTLADKLDSKIYKAIRITDGK